MNIVRITKKNVVFIILGILLTTVKEGYMGYGGNEPLTSQNFYYL